jgi:di/tricarboxylate transporter
MQVTQPKQATNWWWFAGYPIKAIIMVAIVVGIPLAIVSGCER